MREWFSLFLEATKMSRSFWLFCFHTVSTSRRYAHLITRVSRRIVMDCKEVRFIERAQIIKFTNSETNEPQDDDQTKRDRTRRNGKLCRMCKKSMRCGFLVDEKLPRTNYTRFPAKKKCGSETPAKSRKLRNLTLRSWEVEVELIWHYYPYSNKIFVLMNLYNHKPECGLDDARNQMMNRTLRNNGVWGFKTGKKLGMGSS